MVKNLPANAGDPGSIPGLGRSLGEGHGNPFQYSCLGNPMDREAWWATVHGLAKSQVRLSNSTTNVVLVSGAQQSDSVTHIHESILFQTLFSFGLLQSIRQSSLCYIVGPCWLSILNIVVCTCQSQTSNLSLPHPITINLLFV